MVEERETVAGGARLRYRRTYDACEKIGVAVLRLHDKIVVGVLGARIGHTSLGSRRVERLVDRPLDQLVAIVVVLVLLGSPIAQAVGPLEATLDQTGVKDRIGSERLQLTALASLN